jgi:hypothetical protein
VFHLRGSIAFALARNLKEKRQTKHQNDEGVQFGFVFVKLFKTIGGLFENSSGL